MSAVDELRASAIATEATPGVRGIALRCLRYVGVWSIVVVLFAAQWYTHDALLGEPWPMEDYLRWSMVEWYTWAALAPLVFWLAARYPIDSPLRPRFLGVHAVASAGVTLLAVIAGAVVAHALEPGSLDDQLAQFFAKHVAMGFITYWVLVALRQAVHFHREKNRKEIQSSRLAAELAQSRLQVLKMQLQPHFLFNTLHAIATLIDEDPAAAEEMLLRLSELLRAFLEDYEGQEIPLSHELALIDLYLGIQRTRFKDRLTTRVHAAPDTLDCAVPSLILQPLVENAIQHGIGRNVGEDSIEIESIREGDILCLEVRNRNSALERTSDGLSRRGIGLSNSRLRLKELYGDTAEIRLVALRPRGVACRIRLPFRALDMTFPHYAEEIV
jgi:two-component system, LytTR family, sensor kinase